MTGDFDRLRGAMSDLAQHGGSPDVYERALHTSHRRHRRTMLATTGGVAAAVLVAVGAGVALGRGSPHAAPPATGQPFSSSTPSPTPSLSLSPTVTPSSMSSSPSTSSRTSRPPAPHSSAPAGGCTVSATTLDHAPGARLPVDPHTLRCWHNWVIAEPLNPPGDGSYLFRYTAKGGWRFYAEGSAFTCTDLGIQVDPKDPPPFCG